MLKPAKRVQHSKMRQHWSNVKEERILDNQSRMSDFTINFFFCYDRIAAKRDGKFKGCFSLFFLSGIFSHPQFKNNFHFIHLPPQPPFEVDTFQLSPTSLQSFAKKKLWKQVKTEAQNNIEKLVKKPFRVTFLKLSYLSRTPA